MEAPRPRKVQGLPWSSMMEQLTRKITLLSTRLRCMSKDVDDATYYCYFPATANNLPVFRRPSSEEHHLLSRIGQIICQSIGCKL